ncbi:hypothetical protein HYDPIDRAFT_120566 [Hydnomerulius pinastri MD-312]|uniref:Uncharacterized protein n=1 Tax=Hydnomerulius pinastri MD-312 TaxID=994086 RepID=A0A0C2KJF5_9AGAM|nr:hypothetical protein HYDPIDRAFT_120566 [Hydnomerulius pinastri MD-312]
MATKRLYDPSSPTLFLRGLIAREAFVTLSDAYMLRKPLTLATYLSSANLIY